MYISTFVQFHVYYLFGFSDLTRVLAESRNYGELYWAWDGWRDEVGGPAREDYKEYVRLKNKAAQANGMLHKIMWSTWCDILFYTFN